MSTITITLPDDRLLKLKEKAVHFGVTPEELLRVSVEELLARPEQAFQQAVDYVLNREEIPKSLDRFSGRWQDTCSADEIVADI